MSGPAATIVETGGIAVTLVDEGAPVLTFAESGGMAITLVESGGAPFILEGYSPDDGGLGPELITNGDFADGATVWSDASSGFDFADGKATSTDAGALAQVISITPGTYRLQYDILANPGGAIVDAGIDAVGGSENTGTGHVNEDIVVAEVTDGVFFIETEAAGVEIDNITLKQVL
jgi:hypothetical protein